jgi:hypothetical protein
MTGGFPRRVVLDTNVIVSALLQPLGPPSQIFLLAISGLLQLCMSGSVYDWEDGDRHLVCEFSRGHGWASAQTGADENPKALSLPM